MGKMTLCEPCGWAPCTRGHTEGQHEAVTAKMQPDADTSELPGRVFKWNDGAVAVLGASQEEVDAAVARYDHRRTILREKLRGIRERRAPLLAETDIAMAILLDAEAIGEGAPSKRFSLAAYRQALRNLPQVVSLTLSDATPDQIRDFEPAWPEKPLWMAKAQG